jgi:hypothetical protein
MNKQAEQVTKNTEDFKDIFTAVQDKLHKSELEKNYWMDHSKALREELKHHHDLITTLKAMVDNHFEGFLILEKRILALERPHDGIKVHSLESTLDRGPLSLGDDHFVEDMDKGPSEA